MSTSDLIKPFHLGRLAIIYIRQSSPHQALTNQESTRLQYALKQRALELGWHEDQIRIIDEDQGRTASTTEGRQGLKELVTLLTLEHVGIIFSTEVTRLSRNCSDWYPLLDLCGYRNCLIADRDGIHDPSTIDGRLLLGLKGQISELELHTIRGRLTAGLLNKARRGELALALPVGLIRDPLERVVKHPDVEVQGRIALIFETFLRVRSASRVVRSFNADGLLIPRKDDLGDIAWRPPTVPAICSTLENPAYAGAFVYGRTRSTLKAGSTHERTQKRLPMGEWKIRINDKYPAYVDWATFEAIQAMLRDNCSEYDRNKTRGVPRPGKALLHGLVHCGECGHKMVVQYKPKTHYICNFLRQQHQVPVCQFLPADPIDDFAVRAFFGALSPAELDLYDEAASAIRREAESVHRARLEQLDRLRYQARLAERQFTRADPENRLVAAELERRWEAALRELQQAEDSYQRAILSEGPAPMIPPELRRTFEQVGRDLPGLWEQGRLTQAQKKALLRCLIDKVVLHRIAPDSIQVRIVWRGGDTTTAEVPVTVNALARLSSAQEMEETILSLARQGETDQDIAAHLTRQGHRSPKGPIVLVSTVRIIRLRHRLLVKRSQSHPRRIPGHLTVSQVAERLQIAKHWIYDRIHNGTIRVTLDRDRKLYLFPDTPMTITAFEKFKAGEIQEIRF
jgi:DNA invertase Pin-like site-specific DNA recombinase